MGHIKFKLEDGNALACNYVDNTNFIEFEHQDHDGKTLIFKLHKIQILALIKAINGPLHLGLGVKK